MVREARFPPTSQPGQGYLLVDPTQHGTVAGASGTEEKEEGDMKEEATQDTRRRHSRQVYALVVYYLIVLLFSFWLLFDTWSSNFTLMRWIGVSGEALENVLGDINLREWHLPQRGLIGMGLGVAHMALNGVYESLRRLVDTPLPVLSGWSLLQVWHILLVYLMVSGGARLSQVKYFAWSAVRGLIGCADNPAQPLNSPRT